MANILEATGVIKRERELQQQQKAVDSQQITSETLVATESVTPMEESKITSDVKLETEEGDDGDDVGEESETEDNGEEIRGGKPPAAALDKYSAKTKLSIKHRRKLNDLDVDNMTESDSEEYKATR